MSNEQCHAAVLSEIRRRIDYQWDGPLTAFGAISRAAELIATFGCYKADDVANVLYEILLEYDWLTNVEIQHNVTGS